MGYHSIYHFFLLCVHSIVKNRKKVCDLKLLVEYDSVYLQMDGMSITYHTRVETIFSLN